MGNNMTVTTRITTIRLLELMKKQPEYAKEMGLKDTSYYRDKDLQKISEGSSHRRK